MNQLCNGMLANKSNMDVSEREDLIDLILRYNQRSYFALYPFIKNDQQKEIYGTYKKL